MTYRKNNKKALVELGADKLAEALSDLANKSEKANEVVFQLLSSKKEKLKRFKAKLAGIKRRTHFISWRESSDFASRLESLINDLREAVDDPKIGVECVLKFYEADEAIFECCDDSSGAIGYVFSYDALELFVSYASKCKDKEWIASEIERVVENDGYGVRDKLIYRAVEYLPDDILRSMVKRFMVRYAETDDWSKNSWKFMAESVAKQLNDVELYEKVAVAPNGALSNHNHLDAAKIYFANGDFKSALKRLEMISSTINMYDYKKMLVETHRKLGNQKEVIKILQKDFNAHHSLNTLEALLEEVGNDKRKEFLKEAEKKIMKDSTFSVSNTEFLVETGMFATAGEYILARNKKIDGTHYYSLPSIAKELVKADLYLPAVILYRALLEANVAKAISKYYRHGIRYLKELDKISPQIKEWKIIPPHTDYFADFKETHARKSAFWKQYDN